VSNALLALQRRRKMTVREREQALELLRAVPFVIDQDAAARAFSGLSALATVESLSVYDACYLDVAMRHRIPLACKDGPLRRAATRNGVRVDE
jgi:predicted nucleic acid-binding protein